MTAAIRFLILAMIAVLPATGAHAQSAGDLSHKPNIIMIMTDDVASYRYFGLSSRTRRGHHDQYRQRGRRPDGQRLLRPAELHRRPRRLHHWPISDPHGLTSVGQPGSPIGLQKEDPTLAQLLKARGYATAQFGKSHVGDRNEFLPTVHGFDEFYGFLYHLNMMDMPEQAEFPKDPNFVGRPRNVIHALANAKDDPTIDPRWGRVGHQTIADAGPLGSERQKTFDNEVLDRSVTWMKTPSRKRSLSSYGSIRPECTSKFMSRRGGKARAATAPTRTPCFSWTSSSGRCSRRSTIWASAITPSCCSPPTTASISRIGPAPERRRSGARKARHGTEDFVSRCWCAGPAMCPPAIGPASS